MQNNWTQKFKELEVNQSFNENSMYYDTIWQTHSRLKKRNSTKVWEVKKCDGVVTVKRLK